MTLQQLDLYYSPPENFLAAANTQALYQAQLRAQMNATDQRACRLQAKPTKEPQIVTRFLYTTQGNLQRQSIQQPVLPHPFAPQVNQNNASEFIHTHSFKLHNPGDLKHQVCLRTIQPSVYAPDNKLVLSPESFPDNKSSSPRNKCSLEA